MKSNFMCEMSQQLPDLLTFKPSRLTIKKRQRFGCEFCKPRQFQVRTFFHSDSSLLKTLIILRPQK